MKRFIMFAVLVFTFGAFAGCSKLIPAPSSSGQQGVKQSQQSEKLSGEQEAMAKKAIKQLIEGEITIIEGHEAMQGGKSEKYFAAHAAVQQGVKFDSHTKDVRFYEEIDNAGNKQLKMVLESVEWTAHTKPVELSGNLQVVVEISPDKKSGVVKEKIVNGESSVYTGQTLMF